MQITIPMNMIKAALPCAATKDARNYLCGALFAYTQSDKTLRVISTDGHLLSAFSCQYPEPDMDRTDFSIIIPLDTLKAASKEKLAALVLMDTSPGMYALGTTLFKPVDGEFPDYRRVVPAYGSLSGLAGTYDPNLLVRASNAMHAFHGAKNTVYTFTQNDMQMAAVMHNGTSDAMVAIMPWSGNRGADINKTYHPFA